MGKEMKIVLAGFGGQGILFSGKLIAYAALSDGKEVTWLPSYGPEMRGGTANCAVRISDQPIGSPLVTNPKILIAMNQPSFDKFLPATEPQALVFYDSSLITPSAPRTGVSLFPVPATALANEKGLAGLANLILMGKLFAVYPFSSPQGLELGLGKCIPQSKAHLLEANRQALRLGMAWT